MSSRDGKSGRLPTFKAQRDLTLGSRSLPGAGSSSLRGRNRQVVMGTGSALKKAGVSLNLGTGVNSLTGSGDVSNKKKFTPNLNVQRRQTQGENANSLNPDHARGGQASVSQIKREPKAKPNLIQTMNAVFSEGIGEDRGIIRRPRYGGGGSSRSGDSGSGVNMQRPKLNINTNIDKEAEAERLKELLRDDFIDDLTQGPLVPVQLPMIDTGTAFKEEDSKDNVQFKEEIKGEKSKNRRRILDSDDDSDGREESINTIKNDPDSASADASVIAKKHPSKKSDKAKDSKLTFSDLVKMQKGDLLFVQLPDHLPGSIPYKAVKQEDLFSGIKNYGDSIERDSHEENEQPKCTLKVLPEGYLGKIQIRKSGKTQLLIGDTSLDIDLGTQVGFLQDLVSINIPNAEVDSQEQTNLHEKTGDMTVLGHVRHRIVVSPDWERLFNVSERQSLANSTNNRSNDSSSDTSDDEVYNQKIG